MIKVRRGTRSDNAPRLCDTCHRAVIVHGPANGDEKVYCNAVYNSDTPMEPPFRVVECSSYGNKAEVSLSDMREQAWVISTDKKKNAVGFLSPKEYKKQYSEQERENEEVSEPAWMR